MAAILTAGQQLILARVLHEYVQDQLRTGNVFVYQGLREMSGADLQKALAPYIDVKLKDAQDNQAAVTTLQTTQATQADQTVSDLQGLTTTITSL